MDEKVKVALDECRAAFVANQGAKSAWCCHHEVLWEVLTEPYEKRIAYILSSKPEAEHLVRFQNFRPCTAHDLVVPLDKKYEEARAPLYKKYEEDYASLDKKYKEARASLDKKYEEARASLYKKYKDDLASLYKKYEEARAPLYKKYEEARAPLYMKDVPLGTWNGKSIFGGGK